jgi:hypothetical protein
LFLLGVTFCISVCQPPVVKSTKAKAQRAAPDDLYSKPKKDYGIDPLFYVYCKFCFWDNPNELYWLCRMVIVHWLCISLFAHTFPTVAVGLLVAFLFYAPIFLLWHERYIAVHDLVPIPGA